MNSEAQNICYKLNISAKKYKVFGMIDSFISNFFIDHELKYLKKPEIKKIDYADKSYIIITKRTYNDYKLNEETYFFSANSEIPVTYLFISMLTIKDVIKITSQ